MASALSNGIRRAAARLSPDPTPDGELLSRFLTSCDQASFAELVRRHGRMVFGICRRVVGNAADADDAFQAAFVVLVRKAQSLTGRTCVDSFLYATAVLTARKARTMATRRRANEAKAVRPEAVDPPGVDGEATRVLDEELAGLPAKYREPVVLCELEGVSRKEAAARLGIPEGTISSRLATAHRLLAKRLAARGFAAGAVAAVLGQQAFAVPDRLTERAVAHVPPAGVTQLVAEVTKMLLWNKLRTGAAVLTGVVLLLGMGVGLVPRGGAADDKPGVKAAVPEKKAEAKDEDLLQGSWQAVAAESDGKKTPDEAIKAVVLRFKGAEATFPGDLAMTFVLDPKAKPKGLTLTPTAGPNKGVKVESAIYELSGDDLKVCVDWGRDGKAGMRPTDFTTAPRDGRILLTLKRVKEEKKEEPRTADNAKGILGKWVQTAVAVVPNPNAVAPLSRQTLTFDAKGVRTEATDERGETFTSDGKYELNPTTRPKELTLFGKESKSEWIYELDGDKLKMATLGDGTRPASFDPREIPQGRTMKVVEFAREKDEPKKEEAKKAEEPKPASPGTLLLARESGFLALTTEGAEAGEIAPPKGSRSDLQGRLSPDGARVASVATTSEPLGGVGAQTGPWRYRVLIHKFGTADPIAAADFLTHRRPHLCWAPDGKKVVVTTAPEDDGALRNDLVDAATGEFEAITLPANVQVRDWSPDGKTLLALRHENKKYHLVLATPGDKSAKKVVELKSTYGSDLARFSPDGKQILFTDGDPEQADAFRWNRSSRPYVYDVATKQRRPLGEFPKNATCVGLAWSPDGQRVAYTWTQLHEDLLKKTDLLADDVSGRETEGGLVIADVDGKNAKAVKAVKSANALSRFVGTIDWR